MEQPEVNAPGEELTALVSAEGKPQTDAGAGLKAILEAAIYLTDEPLTPEQIAVAIGQPKDQVIAVLEELAAEYSKPEHGLTIREVAGGAQREHAPATPTTHPPPPWNT